MSPPEAYGSSSDAANGRLQRFNPSPWVGRPQRCERLCRTGMAPVARPRGYVSPSLLWICPGAAIWFLLRNDLWFVGFMSVWVIWVGHLSAVAAETPVEEEDE